MLNKIFEVVLEVAITIFLIGAGIVVGRFFAMFTEKAGMYFRDKLPDKVYSVMSIVCSLLLIALVLYKVVVD